jgi:hypothetical protein
MDLLPADRCQAASLSSAAAFNQAGDQSTGLHQLGMDTFWYIDPDKGNDSVWEKLVGGLTSPSTTPTSKSNRTATPRRIRGRHTRELLPQSRSSVRVR